MGSSGPRWWEHMRRAGGWATPAGCSKECGIGILLPGASCMTGTAHDPVFVTIVYCNLGTRSGNSLSSIVSHAILFGLAHVEFSHQELESINASFSEKGPTYLLVLRLEP
jgi:hypothetical protein